MTALDWYPPPKEIDLREPEKPKVVKEGVVRMEKNINWKDKLSISTQYTTNIFAVVGFLYTAYLIGCAIAPDKFLYASLKGMDPKDRLFVQNVLDTCGSRDILNSHADNCMIGVRDLVMVKTGLNTEMQLSMDPPKDKDKDTQVASNPPMANPVGNVQSPTR
jgi:hypothetical protein